MKIQSKGNGLVIDNIPWARDVTKLGRGKYAEVIGDNGKPTPKHQTQRKKAPDSKVSPSVVEEL